MTLPDGCRTTMSSQGRIQQRLSCRSLALLSLALMVPSPTPRMMHAQAASPQPSPSNRDSQQFANIEHRLDELTGTLAQTQKELQQSLIEIQRLHAELDALRAQSQSPTATPALRPATATAPTTGTLESQTASSSSAKDALQALQEQQEIQQAEIKQHDQTKVETESKYRLRVTGLALFNAFSNSGVVDDVQLPTFALPRVPGASHGSVGATLRQTELGIVATGPILAGAQSSAFLNVDFFGGATTNAYNYSSPSGFIRLRDTQVGLAWSKTSLQFGYTEPLISPRSPASYATVAQPALAGSGNLWTWAPQLRVEQRVPFSNQHALTFEGGLIDPPSPHYASIQLDSPVEASRRPGVEGRISFHADNRTTAPARSLAFGIGAYTANQVYNSSTHIHSWAATADWQIPLYRWVDISGEIYRGRAIGGLGGGLYKDILTGTDPITGLGHSVGVETAGGWTQIKFNLNSRLEANATFGMDDVFASNFDSVVLPSSASWFTLAVRNSSVVGNVVYHPNSSLIFSPEYRRILSWTYTGAPTTANIFTLSGGYRF